MKNTISTESHLLERFSSLWSQLPHPIRNLTRENTASVARIIQGIVPINTLHNRIHDLTSSSDIHLENRCCIQGFYGLVNSGIDEKQLFEKIIDIIDPTREVFAENPKSI